MAEIELCIFLQKNREWLSAVNTEENDIPLTDSPPVSPEHMTIIQEDTTGYDSPPTTSIDTILTLEIESGNIAWVETAS